MKRREQHRKSKTELSLRGLAKAVGRSAPAVSEWLKRSDWPFPRTPPFPADIAEKVRAWMAKHLAGRIAQDAEIDVSEIDADDPDVRAKKVRILEARAKLLEIEQGEREGALISREEIEVGRIARILEVKQKMMEVPRRAALIANRTESECAAILGDWMKQICDHFAGGVQ